MPTPESKETPAGIPLDTIHLGDCLELLQQLPAASVDLVVSSPPYNLGKEYEAKRALDAYLDDERLVLAQCARVLKPTGSIFWQVGAFSSDGRLVPLDIRFFPILEDLGLVPINRIIWIRQHGLHARRRLSCRHETILWFAKSAEHYFDLDAIRVPQKYQNKKNYRKDDSNYGQLSCHPDGKNPGDIWVFRNVKHNHEEQTIHPCEFPEDLVARIVLSTSPTGGVVLDPYMGAGTVAVVARDHRRHFLGAEMDERYHEVARRRLSGLPDANGQFANLKNLRDFAERTGEPIEKYRFDVQVGAQATARRNARIYPESHHLAELERRLAFEEETFGADVNDRPRPPDISHKPRVDVAPEQETLFSADS